MLSYLILPFLASFISLASAQANTLQWTEVPSTFTVGVAATLSWQGGDLTTPYNVTLISSCSDLSCAAVIGNLASNTQAQTIQWTPPSSLDLKSYYYLALYQGNNQKQTNNFLVQPAGGGGSAQTTANSQQTSSVVVPTSSSSRAITSTIVFTPTGNPATTLLVITTGGPSSSSATSSANSTSSSSNSTNSDSIASQTSDAFSSNSSTAISSPDNGLPTSTKIGLGVGLGLGGTLLIAGIIAFILRRRANGRYSRHGMGTMEKDLRNQREPGVGVGMGEPGVAVD